MIKIQAKIYCDGAACLETSKIELVFNGDDPNPNHKTWLLSDVPDGWQVDISAPKYKAGKHYCAKHIPKVRKKRVKSPKVDTVEQLVSTDSPEQDDAVATDIDENDFITEADTNAQLV
jgi:hypothetical protein